MPGNDSSLAAYRLLLESLPLELGDLDSLNTSGSGFNLTALLARAGDGQAGVATFRLVIHYIDLYVVPTVALVGLVGNVLSFLVFVCTFMRRLSSSIYLAALALADLGFLLCVLVSWGINTGVDLYAQEGWCQVFMYLTYLSSFLSVWYVVSFTAERYIAVHFPLRRQDLCTTRRAKIVVLSLFGISALLYNFGIWTSGVNDFSQLLNPVCGPLPKYMAFVSIVNNVDTVITLILPFLAILVMNVRIAFKVAQFYRERKHMVIQQYSYSASSRHHTYHHRSPSLTCSQTRAFLPRGDRQLKPPGAQLYNRTQVRVTKMLLTVSTIFLVLNLPRHTLRTYSFIMSLLDVDYHPSPTYVGWQKLFQFLYYMQFSVNLFLYSAFGKNFRKALLLLGRRIKHNAADVVTRISLIRSANAHTHGHAHARTTGREITLRDYRYTSRDSQYV